ncbi:MAG: T9SS type B sorting domain-containing protein [Saprospiraceae bacterium]|nr:T9SS type B sorting domain-containing protein [Saprospiraceae bacterium]
MVRIIVSVYCIICLCAYNSVQAQGCTVDESVLIPALETTDIILSIENLLNEDLSNDQGICGIRIVFEHDQLANLRITLNSPDGQEVILIGPGSVSADFTDLITWNIAFTECANTATPDMGFSATWDNNQLWQSFQTYTGTYFPSMGCLEDFNMGSAIGNWVLSIENLGVSEGALLYFEIILCNDTGNDCNTCILDVGEFQNDYQIFCEDDPRLEYLETELFLPNSISSDQSLYYILSVMDSIIMASDQLNDISDLNPGIYEICGIVIEDISIPIIESALYLSEIINDVDNRLICADITDQCLSLDIRPADNILTIDTLFCRGDTIWIRDIPFSQTMDTVLTVFDTISNNPFNFTCDSIIRISATEVSVDANILNNEDEVNCGQAIFLNGSGSSSTVLPITNYNWLTNGGNFVSDFGPIAEIDAGGTYTLFVSNGLCTDSMDVNIGQTNNFDISLMSEDVFCFGDTMEIEIQSTPQLDSFIYNGPSPVGLMDNSIFSIENGNYIIEAFYGNCNAVDSVILDNEATELTLTVSSTMIDCNNPMSTLDYNTNAVNPTIRFTGPESIPDNTTIPMVSTPGNYTLEVTDEFGCIIIDSVRVDESTDFPEIDIFDVSRTCEDPPVQLALQLLSPVDSVIWTFPNGSISNEINPEATDEGSYTITVFGTNGCITEDSIRLNVINIPFAVDISGDDLNCAQNAVDLCYDNSMISAAEISWSFTGNNVGSTACIEATVAGTYNLEITDQNGCTSAQEYVVNDLSEEIELSINPSALTLDCNTSSIDLELTTTSTSQDQVFQWMYQGDDFADTQNITIFESGTYLASVQDTVSFCEDQAIVLIEEEADPLNAIDIQSAGPDCAEELGSIMINNLPASSDYDIFLNNELIEMPTALQNVVAGIYDIEIISEEGCIFDTIIIVDDVDPFILDIGDDIVGVIGEQVQLNVNASLSIDEVKSFEWSQPQWLSCLDCFNPVLTLTQSADLSLVVTDQNGCKASDELNIIIDKNLEIFVPNIFTPNGDNDNDILTLYISDSIVKIFDIRITDRWGNLLFFHPEITEEFNNFGWDGTFNGYQVGSGVYVIMAKLLLPDNTETFFVEDFTLLR